ncbi:hypothetical protein [Oceanobacillus massiliensis]|uniref:hypothetical protein n=1 Tax=Oceanobacillus massiliensis TaxID=1465765 RepID=UPI0002884FDC|nr:hypothetical protein [Oceanobacillus massiliensis]
MAHLKPILFLDPGHAFGLGNRTDPFIQDNFELIDQYRLAETDLSLFKCIVIHDFIDQEYLYTYRSIITDFLAEGKIIIFTGQLFKAWLPGCSSFTPRDIQSYKDYQVLIAKDHPIFAGVHPDDMTFKKGIAGFFARGTHAPVPAHAEILLTFRDEMPITYIDRNTTNGTILCHSGRDLFAFRNQNKSTDRIIGQLLQWIHDEYEALQREGKQV